MYMQLRYQSRDIADQVSFIISVTRKILLSPTSKIKITHFSCSERFFNHNKNFRTSLELLFNVS